MPEFPVVILPWAYISGDNHRLMLSKRQGRIITSPDYRAKKEYARLLAIKAWKGYPMLETPLELSAKVFYPDARRTRDVANLAKFCCDVLVGISYEDDSQLHRVTFEKAGISTGNPRIELSLSHYRAEAA